MVVLALCWVLLRWGLLVLVWVLGGLLHVRLEVQKRGASFGAGGRVGVLVRVLVEAVDAVLVAVLGKGVFGLVLAHLSVGV
jgi:hypothetical protein